MGVPIARFAAQSKRTRDDDDQPTQTRMGEGHKTRRNATTDERKVRRQMAVKGTVPGMRRSASEMTEVEREGWLLSKMASATTDAEQAAYGAELAELRQARSARVAAERDLDLSDGVLHDTFTPVAVHERTTAASDWLADVDEPTGDGVLEDMRASASLWFERTSPELRADRAEFAEQAMGIARRVASAQGAWAKPAYDTFLGTVARLHKAANGTPENFKPDPDSEDCTACDGKGKVPDGSGGIKQCDACGGSGNASDQGDQVAKSSNRKTAGDSSEHHSYDEDSYVPGKTPSGSDCAVCGDPIARDPKGEEPRTWHHTNGEKHDHEAQPESESKSSLRHMAALNIVADADEFLFEGAPGIRRQAKTAAYTLMLDDVKVAGPFEDRETAEHAKQTAINSGDEGAEDLEIVEFYGDEDAVYEAKLRHQAAQYTWHPDKDTAGNLKPGGFGTLLAAEKSGTGASAGYDIVGYMTYEEAVSKFGEENVERTDSTVPVTIDAQGRRIVADTDRYENPYPAQEQAGYGESSLPDEVTTERSVQEGPLDNFVPAPDAVERPSSDFPVVQENNDGSNSDRNQVDEHTGSLDAAFASLVREAGMVPMRRVAGNGSWGFNRLSIIDTGANSLTFDSFVSRLNEGARSRGIDPGQESDALDAARDLIITEAAGPGYEWAIVGDELRVWPRGEVFSEDTWNKQSGRRTAGTPTGDNANAVSGLPDEPETDEKKEPAWPWELPERDTENSGASDVAGVPTPPPWPQPKSSGRTAADDGSIFCKRCKGSGMVRAGGAVRNCTSCGGSGIKRQVVKKNPDLKDVLPDFKGHRRTAERSCGCPDDYHLADCPLLTGSSGTSDEEWWGQESDPDDLDDWFRESALRAQAGFPLCAKGCNWTLSAGDSLVNTNRGLAHQTCPTPKTAAVKQALAWEQGLTRMSLYPGLVQDVVTWTATDGDYLLSVAASPLGNYFEDSAFVWGVEGALSGGEVASGQAGTEEDAKKAAEAAAKAAPNADQLALAAREGAWRAPTLSSMRKGAPFADYADFADCVSKNQDKDDANAYCATIQRKVEEGKESALAYGGAVGQDFAGAEASARGAGDAVRAGQSREASGVVASGVLATEAAGNRASGGSVRGVWDGQSPSAHGQPSTRGGEAFGGRPHRFDRLSALASGPTIARAAAALRLAVPQLPSRLRAQDGEAVVAQLRGVLASRGLPPWLIDAQIEAEAYCGKIKHQVEDSKESSFRRTAGFLDLDDIPEDFEVQPVASHNNPPPNRMEPDPINGGMKAVTDYVTDGTCGLTWDDSIVTSMTPAPSARCPFEYFHQHDDEEGYEASRRVAFDEDAIDRAVKDLVSTTRCPECGSDNYSFYGPEGATCHNCGNQWRPPPPYAQAHKTAADDGLLYRDVPQGEAVSNAAKKAYEDYKAGGGDKSLAEWLKDTGRTSSLSPQTLAFRQRVQAAFAQKGS